MWLITGLGNPGSKYAENRHNIGFMTVDCLIKTLKASLYDKSKFKGELYRANDIFLLKPKTFMNLSGESVKSVTDYFKITNLITIHDDIDIGFGGMRFKIGGGHGGHNGLRSIDAHFGNEYLRVRIGIGRPENKEDVANYCLHDFSKTQQEFLPQILQTASQATMQLCTDSLQNVSAKYTLKAIT